MPSKQQNSQLHPSVPQIINTIQSHVHPRFIAMHEYYAILTMRNKVINDKPNKQAMGIESEAETNAPP
jgi:hypothetical protein